jgi:hypothetical protein
MLAREITITYIEEVLGLNLDGITSYPEFLVCLFCRSRKVSGPYLKIGHNILLSHPLQFIVHISPYGF